MQDCLMQSCHGRVDDWRISEETTAFLESLGFQLCSQDMIHMGLQTNCLGGNGRSVQKAEMPL